MALVTMYDSVTPPDIPSIATVVAGYADGAYMWSDADWARFPNAVMIHIVTSAATDAGDVLDVEDGDATPDQAPPWVMRRRAAGLADPCVYCNEATWAAARQAFADAGVPEPLWWIARWDNQAEMIPDAAAHQYADPQTSGGHYDLSVVDQAGWPFTREEPMDPATQQAIKDIANAVTDASQPGVTLQAKLDAANHGLAAILAVLQSIEAKLGAAPTAGGYTLAGTIKPE